MDSLARRFGISTEQPKPKNNIVDIHTGKPLLEKKDPGDARFCTVSPLVGEEITQAMQFLKNKPNKYQADISKRNYTLFYFNINVGLRISDLLRLKISDVMAKEEIKDSFAIKEGKTCKKKIVFCRKKVREALKEYILSLEGWKYSGYLFPATKPDHKTWNFDRPMTARNVSNMLYEIEDALGLSVNLGTHSMRKTYARAWFDKYEEEGNAMGMIQLVEKLNHSSEKMTRRYVGLEREQAEEDAMSMCLGDI